MPFLQSGAGDFLRHNECENDMSDDGDGQSAKKNDKQNAAMTHPRNLHERHETRGGEVISQSLISQSFQEVNGG